MNIKHCRICYGPDNDDLISVQLVQDGVTIHNMIRAIVGISVTGDRRLPQNICLHCLDRLKIAFALRQQCINTHERLCEELGSQENVTPPPECISTICKEEPDEELQALQIVRLEDEEPKNESECEAEEQIECVALEQQHNEPWREDVHFVLVHSLPCCGCSMYFDSRYELRVHSAQVHRKQNSRTKYSSFQCTICYQSYADQSGLDRHLEDAEASATVYECLHCSKLFEDRKQLFEHLQQQNESQPIEMVEDVEVFTAPEEQSIDTTSPQAVKIEEIMSENDEEYLLSSDSNVEEDEYSIDISLGEETDVVADGEACEESNAKSLHSPSIQRTVCRISENNLRVVSEESRYMIVELLGQRCCCCAQIYNTEKQLIVHLSQQRTIARSDPYAKYTCEYCGKPFKYSLNFLSHKRLLEQRQFYLCRLCSRLFDSKARMLSHMLMSEEHALFFQVSREDISNRYDTVILPGMRCCCCKLYFEDKDKLLEHIQTVHRTRKGKLASKGFQCEFCKRLFRSVALVERHLRYTKDASQYYCKLCDYQTFNLRRMELHLYSSLHRATVMPMQGVRLKALKNRLSIVPPVRYCCFEDCKMPFHKLESLKQHVETEHLEELNKNKAQTELMGRSSTTKRYHECDVCAQFFPSASALQYHTALSSRQDSICAVCGVRQRTRADLLVHERIHTGERPFACDVCSKTFTSKTKLVAHLKSHGTRDHRCDVCGAQFKRKENLTRHKHLRHGEATIPCEVCGKKFKTVAKLNIHAAVHTGEKRFACRFVGCDKRYITVGDRRRHEMSVHTKERPHVCSHCNSAFVRKRQLTIHERHHTGEKPHVCPTCGKGFYDTHPLKVHLQMGCSHVGSATALTT